MAFLTDRKRATGHGSAKTGTQHHWFMTVSSVALLFLVPCFIFTFAPVIGDSHGDVVAYYSKPFPAIVAILTFVVGFLHFKGGVQVLIEDYVHGLARKLLIIAMTCLSYALIAISVFSILIIAF